MLKRISVAFYRSALDREPVREWLKGLDMEHKRAIGEEIKTVEFGWPLGMPLVRSISGVKSLREVRVDISDGRIARVLFTVKGDQMVLLHGFIKKSQKTPKQDIEAARQRMADLN